MSSAAAARVRAAIEPVLAAAGFFLEEVDVRRAGSRQLAQVVVDKDGGLTLDDVADASRVVSEALDAVDVIGGAYVLEVTSPGVDRPLTLPRHWRRAVGRLVRARRTDGGEVTGRVRAATETSATLDDGGTPVELAYADITKATVQVEFTRDEPGADEDGDAE